MKKFIVLALMVFSTNFAIADSSVWPRVSVWPLGVDVWLDNYSDRDVVCSGTVYMYKGSGRIQTESLYVHVTARTNTYRRFFNYDANDRVRNANHSITCY